MLPISRNSPRCTARLSSAVRRPQERKRSFQWRRNAHQRPGGIAAQIAFPVEQRLEQATVGTARRRPDPPERLRGSATHRDRISQKRVAQCRNSRPAPPGEMLDRMPPGARFRCGRETGNDVLRCFH